MSSHAVKPCTHHMIHNWLHARGSMSRHSSGIHSGSIQPRGLGCDLTQTRLCSSLDNTAKDHRDETNDVKQSHTLMHDLIWSNQCSLALLSQLLQSLGWCQATLDSITDLCLNCVFVAHQGWAVVIVGFGTTGCFMTRAWTEVVSHALVD